MRVKHDYGTFKKVFIANTVTQCPQCEGPTEFAYRSDRHLFSLNGGWHIWYDVRRCASEGCQAHVPEEVSLHALPYSEYGLDVVALIGNRRLRQKLTFAQIGEQLRDEHQVQISDREVERLFGVYLVLVGRPIQQDPERLAALRRQGRIIVSIDAAQPEADGEALWVLRDRMSGEVLRGFSCLSIDAQGIAREIEAVKALGIPIRGVISDAQNIIVQGVRKALPGVPHQLCQYHFLKDLAKTVNQADRALQAELQKHCRGLRTFERAAEQKRAQEGSGKAIMGPATLKRTPPSGGSGIPGRPATRVPLQAPRSDVEAQLVRELCDLIRAVLKTPGRYPLEAPGAQAYAMVQQVLQVMEEELAKKRGIDFSISFASI